jgi:hypothetical protein
MVAAVAWSEEPVYIEHVRKLKPVAHYRLGGTNGAALVNLLATGGVSSAEGWIAGSNALEVVQGPSPREFVGKDRINGFEEDNACIRFRYAESNVNAVVVMPGAAVPDFAAAEEDEVTVSAWVKGRVNQCDRAGIVVRKLADDARDMYQFSLGTWANNYDIVMTQPDERFRSMFTSSSPDGNWQHVVMVFDSKGRYGNEAGAFKLYVNGERTFTCGTKNHARTQMHPTQHDLYIGGMPFEQPLARGVNRSFDGCIDEVTLWDRALSDQEIADLFKAAIIGRKPMVIIVGQI